MRDPVKTRKRRGDAAPSPELWQPPEAGSGREDPRREPAEGASPAHSLGQPREPDFGLGLPERGGALLLEARGVCSSAPAAVGGCHESPRVASQQPARRFSLLKPRTAQPGALSQAPSSVPTVSLLLSVKTVSSLGASLRLATTGSHHGKPRHGSWTPQPREHGICSARGVSVCGAAGIGPTDGAARIAGVCFSWCRRRGSPGSRCRPSGSW